MNHDSIGPESSDHDPAGCACGHGEVANEVVRALIANELDSVRDMLEQIGIQLCANLTIMQDHGELLQGIDELAQRNENLARLLRTPAMEPAIDAISLESLRNRLLDGVAAYVAEHADGPLASMQGKWLSI
jgi:hypothetical protein